MIFVNIATGDIYNKALPVEVKLPYHKNDPIPHAIMKTARVGDPDWEDALVRWMYLNGYAVVYDIVGGNNA